MNAHRHPTTLESPGRAGGWTRITTTHLVAAGLAAAALLGGSASHGAAQAVTVDEGTFDVSLRGSAVGTEAFTIVQRGQGEAQQTLARGQIRLDLPAGTQTLQPLVATVTESMQITQYQLRAGGETEREVRLDRSGERRMHATIVTSEGEREQEFRFEPAAVLLEANVAHHFHFLGARIREGVMSVPVVRPMQRGHATATVNRSGDENVSVGGTDVPATKYTVALDGSTAAVWFDAEWRVLRVEYGNQGYVAVRRDLP